MENSFIPFHKPYVTDDEIREVVEAVKSGWWTSGPKVKSFENEFSKYIGCRNSVSVSSWTAGAHLVLAAIGIKPGDEVIIPDFTFTATAEVVYQLGAKPIIVDVDINTGNILLSAIEKAITKKTRAIIPVHYGGLPCDMYEIMSIAKKYSLFVLEDAAHALTSVYKGNKIGTIGNASCFSFYVTKTLATGEGGMICSEDNELAKKCTVMRLHGISYDSWDRYSEQGNWYYEVVEHGFKYNFTDIQAALGLAQLHKIDELFRMRKNISGAYYNGFAGNDLITLPPQLIDRQSSHHLFTIRLNLDRIKITRSEFIERLKSAGIGTSVHFIPLHYHPYYREKYCLNSSDFPNSERIYSEIISLPIWPGMTESQINKVIESVNEISFKNIK